MEFSREMWLLTPSDYRALQARGNASEDIDLNKTNTTMIQDKVLKSNVKDDAWRTYGTEMSKIIAQGVDNAAQKSSISLAPQSQAQTQAQSQAQTSSPIKSSGLSFIGQGMGKKMVNKATSLYNLLNEIPGVVLNSQNISVDGKNLGNTSDILKALVYAHRYLKYDVTPLLSRIYQRADVTELIGNHKAKEIISRKMSIDPPDFSLDESEANSASFAAAPAAASTPRPNKLSTSKFKTGNSSRRGRGIKIFPKRAQFKWSSIF